MVSWLPALIDLSMMLIISPQSTLEYPNEKSILNRFSAIALTLAVYLAGVIILEDVMSVIKLVSVTACIIMLLILLTPLGAAIMSELEYEEFMHKHVAKTVHSECIGASKEVFHENVPQEDDNAQDIHPFIQASQTHSPLFTRGGHNINLHPPSINPLSSENSLSEGTISILTKNGKNYAKLSDYRTGEAYTLQKALLSGHFWLLVVTTACGMGSGLTAINNISQLGLSLGYSQWNITTFVSLLSIWNFLGRFGAGFVSEQFLHSKGIPRPAFIAIALAIMCLGHLIIASAQPGALYIGLVVVGICYGSQWSLMPATTSEIFGLQHFGTLFNTIAIASPIGSYLLSVRLAGYIYDQEARKEHGDHVTVQLRSPLSELISPQEQSCHGAHCFRLTFIIMAIVCLFGCGIATILTARTKGFYKEIFEKLHEQRKERERDA
ncbi:hypothetical protein O6H91_18G031100 [Diphasiastrum complanatum]|nr:hypothetical protein O6H91_18G031100 [Diphasiastrum complanatum]KAJ7522914.1 hypothetical protein O6H91_18G031100 [Diphasiastrum complanatum]